jgi:uncharacterized membrane protein
MLTNSMEVLAACVLICALVMWTTRQPWAQKFYSVVPYIVLIYYIPTLASTMGILPSQSPAYDWMRDYLLPFSLMILMVTTDIPSVLRIGPKAVAIMLFGTLGIVIGGPVSYLLFQGFLEPESWKGLAALSGSWIGGAGNFAAIKEAVGAPDSVIGPIIIVDTAVGYSWTGVLLLLVPYRKYFDRWNETDSTIFKELNLRIADHQKKAIRPIEVWDVTGILAVGFAGTLFCQRGGEWLFGLTNPYLTQNAPDLSEVFSAFTWTIILITTLGIALSFTRLREIENAGASKIGYGALFLFLVSIGAKADLAGLLQAPVLLFVGIVWILIHAGFLLLGARLLRAPLFLIAVGSQANIGGVATAPIVAAAYYESLAPVGLLMGILGYLIGNYAGLLCAFLLRLAA